MPNNLFKRTLVACLIGASFLAATQLSYAEEKTEVSQVKQTAKKISSIPLDKLDVYKTDPRFNHDFPLTFVESYGYIPLKELIIQPKGRNPFTVQQTLKGYFMANNWKPQKSDLTFLTKVSGANTKNLDDEVSESVEELAFLAANKQALLGEFYSVMLLDEWVQRDKKAGNARANSPINKAREYFEKQNTSRKNSDPESAKKLDEFYRQALQMLPLELQSDVITQYYLKSILFQDFETQQVTETLLSNYHSPDEIGQITTAADMVVALMQEAKFAVQINDGYKPKAQKDLGAVNTNFIGEYLREYGDIVTEKTFGLLKNLNVTQDKDKLNSFVVNISNADQKDTASFTAKINKNGRGLDIFMDKADSNSDLFYAQLENDQFVFYDVTEYIKTYTFKRDKNVTEDKISTLITKADKSFDYKSYENFENLKPFAFYKELGNASGTKVDVGDRDAFKDSQILYLRAIDQDKNNLSYFIDLIKNDPKHPDDFQLYTAKECEMGVAKYDIVKHIDFGKQIDAYITTSWNKMTSRGYDSYIKLAIPTKYNKVCLTFGLGRDVSSPDKFANTIKAIDAVLNSYQKGITY